MFDKTIVWVRGAGELGSGVAHLLHRVGFSVFMSDISPPLAIRRPVTFSDAIMDGSTTVQGVLAKSIQKYELPQPTPWSYIPVFEDEAEQLCKLAPDIIVDARMIKHYAEDFRPWAKLMIGLGPGFDTSKNCHRVIETMRGHDLARVISDGRSSKDTGIPGVVGGETSRRIVRAPQAGRVTWQVEFGQIVGQDQQLGSIDNSISILAPLDGIVRGLISHHTPVIKGMKIGDVDPRGASVEYLHISEKARAIASGVFEAIVLYLKAQSRA
ncbi:MAG: selenium-dependent molybdenum cofactor biosynthesis protein YqeB [Candidatus Marinimicrobia bacterium]|nr:selenium-dependent molybdenum cofactor biosynthesis protein YqeB [Candidatus Neomarinimicrobiota bacterium]